MKHSHPLTTLPPARSAALAVLHDTLLLGHELQAALDTQIRRLHLAPKDSALTSELSYGYLRHKQRLTFCLEHFLRKPQKLPPFCLLAFGVATYEVLFLDRVPEYATRSWLTNLVRQKWGSSLVRVASAYMTFVANNSTALNQPDFYRQGAQDEQRYLTNFYSLPPWVLALWHTSYGCEKTIALAQKQLQPSLLGLRINPRHERRERLKQEYTDHIQDVHILDSMSVACSREIAKDIFPALADDVHAGAVSLQSLAAQEVLKILFADQCNEPVWDACAGRGGKTCYLLERGGQAVWASDSSLYKLRSLVGELKRLDLPRIPIIQTRAEAPTAWKVVPGTILLDVPCTGLGVLSRNPDIKWKRTHADIRPLVKVQAEILKNAARHLRCGGRIVYITCTANPAENESQVESFLNAHDDFFEQQRFDGISETNLGEFFWGTVLVRK